MLYIYHTLNFLKNLKQGLAKLSLYYLNTKSQALLNRTYTI